MKHSGWMIWLFATSILHAQGVEDAGAKGPHLTRQEARSDLAFLDKTIREVHFDPFSKIREAEFDRARSKLEASFGERVSHADFIRGACRLVALLGDGHTRVHDIDAAILPAYRKGRFLPFRAAFDGRVVTITRCAGVGAGDLSPGDRVLEINGRDAGVLYRSLLARTFGSGAMRRDFIETRFPRACWSAGLRAPFRVRIAQRAGGASELVLVDGIEVQVAQRLSKIVRNADPFSFRVTRDGIGVLEYASCVASEAFSRFLAKTFRRLSKEKIEKLVIDVRRNSGGDSSANDLLLAWLTSTSYRQGTARSWKVSAAMKEQMRGARFRAALGDEICDRFLAKKNGEIFELRDESVYAPEKRSPRYTGEYCLLTGPTTFSSATMLADTVKTFGLCKIVGQPTGDRVNSFGEQLRFRMPHSQLLFWVSTTYDIGASGRASPNRPVQPDVLVKDMAPRGDRDPGLEAARRVLRKG